MKAFVEGAGCSLNKADTGQIQGILLQNGYSLAEKPEKADLIILNTCAVKEQTEAKMLKRIRQLHKISQKKKIPLIVFGCLPKINPAAISAISKSIVQIGPSLELLCDFLQLPQKCFSPETEEKHSGSTIAILPIARGCLGNCAYCCVKNARGPLKSYPIPVLEKKFRKLLSSHKAFFASQNIEKQKLFVPRKPAGLLGSLGKNCASHREIWLTAQDCGCYGFDNGTNLVELLKTLLRNKGDFRIRIGMVNPGHLKGFLRDYVSLFEDRRLYRFFHLPVQSGSNAVLAAMNRPYKREDFLRIAKEIRECFPDASISTDIIAGFPGETESQFNESVSLVQAAMPDVVNISRFGCRPNTLAAAMPGQLHGREKKKRSRLLSLLCREISLQRNSRLVGTVQEILLDEKGKGNTVVGRSQDYKPVVLQKGRLGAFAKVEIKKAFPTHLLGVAFGK